MVPFLIVNNNNNMKCLTNFDCRKSGGSDKEVDGSDGVGNNGRNPSEPEPARPSFRIRVWHLTTPSRLLFHRIHPLQVTITTLLLLFSNS